MNREFGLHEGLDNPGFIVDSNAELQIDARKLESSSDRSDVLYPNYGSTNSKKGMYEANAPENLKNHQNIKPRDIGKYDGEDGLCTEVNDSSSVRGSERKFHKRDTGADKNVEHGTDLDEGQATSGESIFVYNAGSINNDSSRKSSKGYYGDIRLSMDITKPYDQDNGKFSLPFNTSFDSNENEKSVPVYFQSHSSETNSLCCNCSAKSLEVYKIILKYFVQRPLFCFTIWSMGYIFWGDEALPGGSLFALTVLELLALFLGYVAELLQLPGLLGMVAAGLILRNVPYINVAKDLSLSVSSPLRGISIVILLIRGALGVNPVNIKKFKRVIPSLVIGSCVVEAIAATLAVYFILDFPIEWASLMGCIISAMSGVAVVPYVAKAEAQFSSIVDDSSRSPNFSTVMATVRTACGLDAMIAICLADVALGFVFAEGELGLGFVKGLVEVVIGGVAGICWGLLAGLLLDETSTNEKRCCTVVACGVMTFLGFPKIGYARAGPLAVFAGVLISTTLWKKKQIGGKNNEQFAATFTIAWYIFQPLLFSIIGARTDFETVDWSIVWKGLICLLISLTIRFATTFFTTTMTGRFSMKERIYICIAWIPKGTVQAALGPAALDTILSLDNLKSPDTYEDLAYKVMHLSAVSFIAAATLGCLCMRFIGPKLLTR